jgi:uncharacterized Fe-S radical SAM superfamily protein PflX
MFLLLHLVILSKCALQESGRGFNRYKKKGSCGAKSETRAKQSSSGTKRGAKVKIETAANRKQ